MGFFSKLSSRNKAVELIAKGYAYAISAIHTYEEFGSYNFLEIAMWVTKTAIVKPAVDEGIINNPQYPIYVQQNGKVVKIYFQDILDRTWNRLMVLLEELKEDDEEEYYRVTEIASMGKAYYEVQRNLPPIIRSAFPDLVW